MKYLLNRRPFSNPKVTIKLSGVQKNPKAKSRIKVRAEVKPNQSQRMDRTSGGTKRLYSRVISGLCAMTLLYQCQYQTVANCGRFILLRAWPPLFASSPPLLPFTPFFSLSPPYLAFRWEMIQNNQVPSPIRTCDAAREIIHHAQFMTSSGHFPYGVARLPEASFGDCVRRQDVSRGPSDCHSLWARQATRHPGAHQSTPSSTNRHGNGIGGLVGE